MENLIKLISENSIVKVKNKCYKPLAKVHYVTQENPNDEYVKVFMEGHYALVISPTDNFMYFGKDVGAITDSYPTPNELFYKSQKFSKLTSDYQIVKILEFGNVLETEGEVEFIDYECSTDNNQMISVGLIVRNKKRADIVAQVISLDDIEIL